ncbi:MAG: peptide chain release factor N(5)-glutamine methyltransferase [Oscillospiraceae bacterium]|nr:peptide chain release factor N(5)-glutamine methyltransferase [Oscillospiraceae bacterium]
MKQTDTALLRELTEILRAGGIEDAGLEAQWICGDMPDAERARETAKRRAAHEPLQYLLGTWEFYGLPMQVGPGVLIPRADTETLVDAVLERQQHLPQTPAAADLCTGSGCIALALKSRLPQLTVTGIDKSETALGYARRNAGANRLDVQWCCDDVLAPANLPGMLDLIVCNPPYLTADDMANLQQEVAFEPEEALFGGADGLDFYRSITALWKDVLRQGGLLAYEIGCTQGAAVEAILRQNGFRDTEIIRDLSGLERVVLGYRS